MQISFAASTLICYHLAYHIQTYVRVRRLGSGLPHCPETGQLRFENVQLWTKIDKFTVCSIKRFCPPVHGLDLTTLDDEVCSVVRYTDWLSKNTCGPVFSVSILLSTCKTLDLTSSRPTSSVSFAQWKANCPVNELALLCIRLADTLPKLYMEHRWHLLHLV